MKKRMICTILAVSVAAGTCLSGCGSKESVETAATSDANSITYHSTLWCTSDYEDGSYVEKMIEDALGIEIKVEKAQTEDTIDLMLAAGEMPDCAWLWKNVDWMYEQELVRSIPRSMVEEYCPRLIEYYDEYPLIYEQTLNPENKDEFRYLRGVTYQFVDYYLPCDYYRYDWIEKLGIDLGVNVEQVSDRVYVADTGIEVSKFEEIMDGFVNGDPDGNGQKDTVGATAEMLNLGQFYSGFGFHDKINDNDGKAEQSYAMDEYKDYLKKFADMYSKGLIDPEIVTGDRTLSWDKVNSGVAGYWITSTNALNSWAVDRPPLTLLSADPDAKILLTPGLRPDGGEPQGLTDESPAYGNFYVGAQVSDEKLAVILKFLDYTLFGAGDTDVHASLIYGEQGVDWEWNEDKTDPIQINTLQSGAKGTWSFGQWGQDHDVTKWTGEEELFKAGEKYWSASAYGTWMQYHTIQYKLDLANVTDYGKIEQEISGDLDAYVSSYRTQAVLGQIDIDETWDDYLAELDRIGYNDMMAELDSVEPLADIRESYQK